METEGYKTQIFRRLNDCFSTEDKHFAESNVLFVWDDAVEYEKEKRRVSAEQTVSPECFSEVFAPLLAGGPSWIHANAVPFGKGRFLITLAAGQKIGSLQPSINVSCEPEKQAEIIVTKTLVTAN